MKKRDLTKLVLMGMAAGSLVGSQSIYADDAEDQNNSSENLIAHNCGGSGGGSCGGQPRPQMQSAPRYVDNGSQPHSCGGSGAPQQYRSQQWNQAYTENEMQNPGQPHSCSGTGTPQQYRSQPYGQPHSCTTAQPDPSYRNPQGRYLTADEGDAKEDLFASDEENNENILLADDSDEESNGDSSLAHHDGDEDHEDLLADGEEGKSEDILA